MKLLTILADASLSAGLFLLRSRTLRTSENNLSFSSDCIGAAPELEVFLAVSITLANLSDADLVSIIAAAFAYLLFLLSALPINQHKLPFPKESYFQVHLTNIYVRALK
jgi:hypothetical protein